MPDPHIDLTVIVSGQPTTVRANPHAPLQTVVAKALEQTHNTGQPPENWELKYDGKVLDLSATIESFGFPAGANLFLTLKAGIGGDV
ncbi:MAG TPA: DUF2604 domain-containing protein [Candidatus Dormibacteraeota bacterium]|nr:DUF2604 domain-containing protein [Candidatus Dormibacteraeota bacterium]